MSVANSHAPETIGNYTIEHALAHGSMGTVYVARHALTYARVALKVLRHEANFDKQAEERFLREVRAAAQIGHEGIVKVQDAGKTPEGHLYLAMELLTGETLEQRMAHGTGERLTSMDWIAALLEPLTAAHQNSIVHRDLKPANVFIARKSDGSEHVKLVDFGLARDTREKSGTQTGIALGTPYYMSPEQAARPKDVSPASDVWSVGVMMYEVLTGHMPFEGETLHAVVIQAATTAHVPCNDRVPELDRELSALVDACLSKDPALRPANAGELRARLVPLLDDENVRAELANAPPRNTGDRMGEDPEPRRLVFADTAIALAHDSRIQDVHPRVKSSGLGVWISAFAILALVIAGIFFALERSWDKNAAPVAKRVDQAPPAPEHAAPPARPIEGEARAQLPAAANEPGPATTEGQDSQLGSRRDRGRARKGAAAAPGVAQPPTPWEPGEPLAPSDQWQEPSAAPEAPAAPSAAPESASAAPAAAAAAEPAQESAVPSGETRSATPDSAPAAAPPSAQAPSAPVQAPVNEPAPAPPPPAAQAAPAIPPPTAESSRTALPPAGQAVPAVPPPAAESTRAAPLSAADSTRAAPLAAAAPAPTPLPAAAPTALPPEPSGNP